jgi:outer membrane protein, heavy metal efflux system
MMIQRLLVIAFSIVLIALFNRVYPQQTGFPSPGNNTIFNTKLQTLIDAAKNNPKLKAADAKVHASEANAKSQKSLDPPQVAMEFYQAPVASFPNPFRNQMEYDYSIQQMIPFPGKLGAMALSEHKRTDMLLADRQTEEQEIVRSVKSVYYDVYLKYRQLEINQETQKLIREFIKIARTQYEVGAGKQSDILRAQTELSSFVSDSIVLNQEIKSMQGMLNALCNRPVTTEIGFIPEIYPSNKSYDLNTMLLIAEKKRPELKSMNKGIELQQAERLAAKKEYLPDFMVRGMYKQMTQTNDDWSLMVGATIPIAPWSAKKYSSAIARTDADIVSAQNERDNMKNMIASEVNDALLKVESARDRLKLYKETVVPQAEQTLESALPAYRTGKQDFLSILDIQRMLVTAKLDYHMAVMSLLDCQSRLERAVGLSIEDLDKEIERGN